MITVLEVKPTGLVLCPTELNGEEFVRLLALPQLLQLTVTDVSSRHLRRLVTQSKKTFSTSEKAGFCVLTRVASPRPGLTLEDLDQQLAWHAQRVAELATDRKALVKYEEKVAAIELKQSVCPGGTDFSEATVSGALGLPVRHALPVDTEPDYGFLGGPA